MAGVCARIAETRIPPLRFATLGTPNFAGTGTGLIDALVASRHCLKPASIAGLIRGFSGFVVFMRPVLRLGLFPRFQCAGMPARFHVALEDERGGELVDDGRAFARVVAGGIQDFVGLAGG